MCEQEEDTIADEVMRMKVPVLSLQRKEEPFFKPRNSVLSLDFDGHDITSESCQCKEGEKRMQRRKNSRSSEKVHCETISQTEQYINHLSGGISLSESEKNFFEFRMGYDFSDVKIHTGTEAVTSAQEINAIAYTNGNNIVFNQGQYAPETNTGKKLLAHELTHVVQQAKNPSAKNESVQRQPLVRTDSIHDPLLDQYSDETGLPREGVTQHDPGYDTWLQNAAVSNMIAPQIDASCTNNQMISNTVREALRWIDDIYSQLVSFETDVIFGNPSVDFQRISSVLLQTFHTTEWDYVQVIASRFFHIGQMLREPGRVTIFCGGRGCRGVGSSVVSAFVDTPYQIHICGNNPDIATFIHEMGHAVVPSTGIHNTVRPSGGLNDRAYTHERAFHHLSPEEALDNAESYGVLAEALHNRTSVNLVPVQPDSVAGTCPDNHLPLAAIARAELAVRWGWRMLGAWLHFLNGRPLADLPQGDQDFIAANLPSVSSVADISSLYQSFTTLYASGFHSVNVDFHCIGNISQCSNGIVGIASGGKVTASTLTQGANHTTGMIDLCDSWFALSSTDRVKTVFALYLLGLGSGAIGSLNQADGFKLIEFSLAVENRKMPQPTTHSALAHMFADQPTAPLRGAGTHP